MQLEGLESAVIFTKFVAFYPKNLTLVATVICSWEWT